MIVRRMRRGFFPVSWFLGGRIICDRKGVFSLQLVMRQIQKRYIHVFIRLLFFSTTLICSGIVVTFSF